MRSLAEVIGMIAGDPSCVLCLPLTGDSIQNGKVLDMSRYGNHGTVTGAIPHIPVLDNVNICPNGNVEADISGSWWTYFDTANGAAGSTLWDGVNFMQGAKSAQCNVTAGGTSKYHVQFRNYNLTSLDITKTYEISFCYKSNAALGNAEFAILRNGGAFNSCSPTYSLQPVANWKRFSTIFTPLANYDNQMTACFNIGNNGANYTFNVDDLSVRQVSSFQSGVGLYFDGVDDVITVPNSDSINVLDDISICLWLNMRGISGTNSMISKGTPTEGYGIGESASSFRPYMRYGAGQFAIIYPPVNPNLFNRWWHYGFSRTGSSVAAYVNGVNIGTNVTNPHTGSMTDKTSNLTIGGATKRPMCVGLLSILNRALTPSEFASHYNLTRPFIGV